MAQRKLAGFAYSVVLGTGMFFCAEPVLGQCRYELTLTSQIECSDGSMTTSDPWDINNSSQVCGRVYGCGGSDYAPYFWDGGQDTGMQIDMPDEFYKFWPTSINNNGLIVGSGYKTEQEGNISHHAAAWQNGTWTILPGISPQNYPDYDYGPPCWAVACNDAGTIVGGVAAEDGMYAGIWQSGNLSVIPQTHSINAFATAISESGTVAGSFYLTDEKGRLVDHVFIYKDGVFTDIGAPENATSVGVTGINDALMIVLNAEIGNQPLWRSYVWKAGKFSQLELPKGMQRSVVQGLNASGTAVGYCDNGSSVSSKAVRWDNQQIVMLDQFVSGPVPIRSAAQAINDQGQIVSYGTFENETTWLTYILTPEAATSGDVNCDAHVDVNDLTEIILNWGVSGGPADLNFDQVVDSGDLEQVLMNWSK
ncbi:MAG TPA: hypothetical protein VG711_00165 [Phycisphaerales bacterium]|nr:hypothetical protein [Phycisphaerales bacterium]